MQQPTNARGYQELDRKYIHSVSMWEMTLECVHVCTMTSYVQARPGHEPQDVPYIVNRGNPTKETDYGLLNFINFCIQITFDRTKESTPLQPKY